MSSVAVVRDLLVAHSPLVAQVPATRIFPGVVPQGTGLPAISVTVVSAVWGNMVAATSRRLCTSRVQVTVMASSYAAKESIKALVRAALPRSRGQVGSIDVDSVLSDVEGPDFTDDAGSIVQQSLDFIVRFYE